MYSLGPRPALIREPETSTFGHAFEVELWELPIDKFGWVGGSKGQVSGLASPTPPASPMPTLKQHRRHPSHGKNALSHALPLAYTHTPGAIQLQAHPNVKTFLPD
jgi:hypothetical protein